MNRHEISGTLRLNAQTLNKYLAVLEGTYMFTLLPPFFTNVRKEISKMKKAYVFDPGVRRIITNGRPVVSLDEVSGPDIENFIFTVLRSGRLLIGYIKIGRSQIGRSSPSQKSIPGELPATSASSRFYPAYPKRRRKEPSS